jgi:hypothetical protein
MKYFRPILSCLIFLMGTTPIGAKSSGKQGGSSSSSSSSICQQDDDGSRDVISPSGTRRRHKPNTTGSVVVPTETFVSTFYITYAGPEDKFDATNGDAIQFLQNSIRDTYNAEIGCDSDLILDDVQLGQQTLTVVETGGGNRKLGSIGLAYSLINKYTATGRCKNCGGQARLVTNDAVKRKLQSHIRRHRQVQQTTTGSDNPLTQFNANLVTALTDQTDFESFRTIQGASLTDDQPANWENAAEPDFMEDFNFDFTPPNFPSP